MKEKESLFHRPFRPRYDRACDTWEPQCPHGDICSGCDAAGYCERGRDAAAKHPLDECVATYEAVEELVEAGDTGCTLCGRPPEYHRHESGLIDSFWWCGKPGCDEPRVDHYLTCATHQGTVDV